MRIPIVNEKDEIIGYKDRKDRSPKDIIRITNLWLTDFSGNILLAQRSFKKDTNPGLWGPAVSGTVEEGETYESNIIKEAEEEIGLKNFKPVLDKKVRSLSSRDYFSQWFTYVVDHNYPFVKDDEEVENIKWFSQNELQELLKNKPTIFLVSVKVHLDYFIKYANKN